MSLRQRDPDGGKRQRRASSAVYGMPKVAATMNAAVDILPMDRIAARLVEVVCGQPVAAAKAE
jgi:chemotaxis response regulator CheB